MSNSAKLHLPDGQYLELPVLTGSENEKAIDISDLRAKTGHIVLDPGYVNTGPCESSITYLNGEKGILHYRGYPIEELALHSSFIEVAYLLIHGELPKKDQLEEYAVSQGEPAFRGRQLHDWLYKKGAKSLKDISVLLCISEGDKKYTTFSSNDFKTVKINIANRIKKNIKKYILDLTFLLNMLYILND